jgi:hypothetical protein
VKSEESEVQALVEAEDFGVDATKPRDDMRFQLVVAQGAEDHHLEPADPVDLVRP